MDKQREGWSALHCAAHRYDHDDHDDVCDDDDDYYYDDDHDHHDMDNEIVSNS